MKRALLVPLLFGVLSGCGGDELTGVAEIDVTSYPAGTAFRMTVAMTSCSDSCATYEEPVCDVTVDDAERTIEVAASVCFERTTDDCLELCGPRILAHCMVPAIPSGTYIVKSGVFNKSIEVR